ncbi:spore germination protein KC [Paenibacillus sp. V4I3]|uniref:Ger(x)C family spore germination protein n=1 Tax=unclassified Paenibacillus TaxID=185978 RepID=UPI002780EF2B|nr:MULTISPECIES: Ger(x)C family spore germination protein [unclassified Paenibacillus]MDQ0876941.1 spore germination protein KC [Paenibacillus sp. V4I3]MDQ0887180.1 spore germination protein KC [Paenibacillus sp. V4I9]
MIRRIWMSLSLSALFVLTGCWDRAELPEKGFVMGIALDQASGGKISLTTQVFRPTQGVGSIGGKSPDVSFANVTTIDRTLPRAIRDIPINLGRKTQWSHTRLIIISEKLAREQEIFSLLEFFYRDHEPRLTVSIMIAEGRADKYLNMKPFIENTISQQLFQSEKASASNSGKTIETNLLKMGMQMKSEVGNAMVPFLYLSKDSETVTNVAGIALLKAGKLVGKMEPEKVESLQMLLNTYQSGMLDIPCQNPSKPNQKVEAVEIVDLKSKWQPTSLEEHSLKVHVKLNMEVAVMELSCSKLETIADEKKFAKNVEETVKQQITGTINWLKKTKFDAIGLGNKVYQKNPSLWKQWKKDWDDQFASSEFDLDVDVKVINSGTTIGKPIFKK